MRFTGRHNENPQSGISLLAVLMFMAAAALFATAVQNIISNNLQTAKKFSELEDFCDIKRYINFRVDCTATNTATGTCDPGETSAIKSTNSPTEEIVATSGRKFNSVEVQAWCDPANVGMYTILKRTSYDPVWSKLFILDCTVTHNTAKKCKEL